MGRQNETVKVTTFNRPKEMADQVFTLNVLDNKNYTLSSDGGFSARGQAGQILKKRRRHADGRSHSRPPGQ